MRGVSRPAGPFGTPRPVIRLSATLGARPGRLLISLLPVLAVATLAVLATIPVASRLATSPPAADVAGSAQDPVGPSAPASVPVFGPRVFEAARGGAQHHVETFTAEAVPGTRYRLEVENGAADGSGRVSAAAVALNGAELLTERDFDATTGGASLEVELAAENVLEVTVRGADGDHLTITVWREADPTFVLWEETVVRGTGTPGWGEWTVAVPEDAAAPFLLHLVNGELDGSDRATSARVLVNGAQVVGPADLDRKSPGLVRTVELAAGTEATVAVRLEGQPGATLRLRLAATDTVPPVLTDLQPPEGSVTNALETELTGGIEDRTATRVWVGDELAELLGDGTAFRFLAPLPDEGDNALAITAVDAAGNRTDSLRTVVRDTEPPALFLTDPADGLITAETSVAVAGSVEDLTPVSVTADGVALLVDGPTEYTGSVETSVFSGEASLGSEGSNWVTVTATDAATNASSETRHVIRDTEAPVLSIASPEDGAEVETETVVVSGTVADLTAVSVTVNGEPVSVDGFGEYSNDVRSGSWSREVALAEGENAITVSATDGAGNGAVATRVVVRKAAMADLPPDPASVAPALDPSGATSVAGATAFLYTGEDPIQREADAAAMDPVRVSVLRGRVLDRAGEALSGVRVDVVGRAEFGWTLTREDGRYDLAVNGGGPVTLQFERNGYLPAERTREVPWEQYVPVDDVTLVRLDPEATTVELATLDEPVMHRGSVQTDADGPRQAAVVFEPGTSARMILPDGTEQPLGTLTVRATEYTVGDGGKRAMPAELPPTSGYTYAVELTVEEAESAGAVGVRFDRPVPFYVENFLGFPVGIPVPVGYYDRQLGAWIPMPNGRIIGIVSAAGGRAEVDIDGDGVGEDDATLAAHGIDAAERTTLAESYAVGTSLWRAELDHFSAIDLNYPVDDEGDDTPEEPEEEEPQADDCEQGGSVIECESQVLGERIPVVGTGWALNYRSDRVPGRDANRSLTIPLTRDDISDAMTRIHLEVYVAGQVHKDTFPAEPGLEVEFRWDGKDAYGRDLGGTTPVAVSIGYVYPQYYLLPPSDVEAFGLTCEPAEDAATGGWQACMIPQSVNEQARQEKVRWTTWYGTLGTWDDRSRGLAGWSLDPHHAYDPTARVVYQGDGSKRSAASLPSRIDNFAGFGLAGYTGDGGDARLARMNSPARVAVGPDGSVYVAEEWSRAVRKIDTDGIITTVAGGNGRGYEGDGGPATEAQLWWAEDIEVGADGSLYIADRSRVRKVDPEGIITTVAGQTSAGFAGDGGPATDALLVSASGIALGPDGTLYIADTYNFRIRAVTPDGIIRTVAGTGELCFNDDGIWEYLCTEGEPALQGRFDYIWDLDVGPEGAIYFTEGGYVIRKIRRDGIVVTVGGRGGEYCNSWSDPLCGDDGPAVGATLGAPGNVDVAPDGTIYFADRWNNRVRKIDPRGLISNVAGTPGEYCPFSWFWWRPEPEEVDPCGDGGPAQAALLDRPTDATLGPDGKLYIADNDQDRVRVVTPPLAKSRGQTIIASADGARLFRFAADGRHLSTISALTGATLYAFEYGPEGRLAAVEDANGLRTEIERGDAAPAAIVSPYGQRTELAVDGNGFLAAITNPAGETTTLTHGAGGLLTGMSDPLGRAHAYSYDAAGRLVADEGPTGGVSTLARSAVPDGSEVAFTSAEDRVTTYRVEDLGPEGSRRTVIRPGGAKFHTTSRPDGSSRTVQPTGQLQELTLHADDRNGLLARRQQDLRASTPSGLLMEVSRRRSTSLVDPGDPTSIQLRTDSVVVNGRTSVTIYDLITGLVQATTPAGRVTIVKRDSLGRPTEETVAGLATTLRTYDSSGRPSTTSKGSRTWTYTYDQAGSLHSTTDPLGRVDSLFYDAGGRVVRQRLHGERELHYEYDRAGSLISVQPPGRSEHRFVYDAGGRDAVYDPPDVGLPEDRTFHHYDEDGNLLQLLRPDGLAIDFAYDDAGRVDIARSPRGTVDYVYNATTGQLTGITAPGGEALSFAYDGSLPTLTAWTGTISGEIGFTYDNDFRLSSLSVNGTAVGYGYDADGLLTSAGDLTLNRDGSTGFLRSTSLGDVTTRRGYNEHGEVSGDSAWAAGTMVFARTYQRDDLGRITSVEDFADGVTTLWEYGYDNAGRLETVSRNEAQYATYDYDENGNRLSRISSSGVETGSYDAQDRLLSYAEAEYGYSANGDLATKVENDDSTRYAYDAFGNLTRVDLPDGSVIQYVIDGRNRRVGKKVDGVLVQGFLYGDQLKPVAELDGSGDVVSRFIYGAKANVPEYMVQGGTTFRILSDHVGSVRLVVNVLTGDVVQRLSYDAWGRTLEDTNPGFQPFGFAGGLWEPETGMVRLGARDYDVFVARWSTKDPLGFVGGDSNLYAYGLSDPLNRLDPSGLSSDCPTGDCSAALRDFGLSFLFDASGLSIARGVAHLWRARRLHNATAGFYDEAGRLFGAGHGPDGFAMLDHAYTLHGVAGSEAAQVLPNVMGGAAIMGANFMRMDPASLLEWAKIAPVLGSGLNLGEALNACGIL